MIKGELFTFEPRIGLFIKDVFLLSCHFSATTPNPFMDVAWCILREPSFV